MLSIIGIIKPIIIPSMILSILWGLYRALIKRDEAAGLALYIMLIIVADNYYQVGIKVPMLEQGTIRYSEVLFLVLYFLYYREKSQRIELKIKFFIILYFSLFLFAAFRGKTLWDGMWNFRAYMIPQIISVFISMRSTRSNEFYRNFFFYIAILCIFMGVIVFWDKFYDINILHPKSVVGFYYYFPRSQGRFGSLFLNPNMYGAFIVLIFFNLLYCFWELKGLIKKVILIVSILLTAFGLILTHSRGPLAAMVCACFIFLILPIPSLPSRKKIPLLGGLILILFLLMPGFYETASRRFVYDNPEYEQDPTKVSRMTTWGMTIELIKKNPLFGIGLGEREYVTSVRSETDFISRYGRTLHNPHNSYLQIAVMAGVIALFCFVVTNVNILWKCLRMVYNKVNISKNLLVSCLISGITGFLLTIMVDQSMFTSVASIYWIMLGFSYSLCIEKSNSKGLG